MKVEGLKLRVRGWGLGVGGGGGCVVFLRSTGWTTSYKVSISEEFVSKSDDFSPVKVQALSCDT